jgi:hypothetical protein
MSINWAMPSVGVRVVDRRPTRTKLPLALDSGWVFRPFQPPASPGSQRDGEPTFQSGADSSAAELTESLKDCTIAAG